MKKSKVTQVTSNGTWEGKFGLMYKFEVSFENGDCGEYSGKSQEQTKFVEGQEAEYEYIDGKFPKVKPVYAQPSSNGSFGYRKDDNVQELIVRQSSLRSAVEFCKGSDGSVEDIFYLADECYKWVMGGKPITNDKNFDSLTGSHDNKLKEKDDLPF